MADEYRSPESYDYPGTGYDEVEYVEEGGLGDTLEGIKEGALPILQQYGKHIIAGVAALIVLYVLYYFLIASVIDYEITVLDSEGELVSSATVNVYAPGGADPLESVDGSGIVKLRFGTYEAAVVASDYKSKPRMPIEVSETVKSANIILEEDKDLQITAVGFPERVYTGQELFVPVNIKNSGGAAEQVELKAGGDFEGDFEISYEQIVVPAGSSADAELKILVKENAEAGSSKEGNFRIVGLRKEVDVSYELVDFDARNMRINPDDISFRRVKAGKRAQEEIEIENRGDFAIEDIEFDVINIHPQNNSKNSVRAWFSFNPEGISNLDTGRDGETITLIVDVPFDALEDTINADIELKTSFWRETIDMELSIEEVVAELEISGLSSSYRIRKEESGYEKNDDDILIKNEGDLDVEDVKIQSDCDAPWVVFDQTSIPKIRADGEYPLVVSVSAPDSFSEDDSRVCNVRIVYNDPKDPLSQLEVIEKIIINT